MDSKKFRNGIHLQPLSADPSSPAEGDIFVSDGTSRGKGLWIYKDGAWTKAGGGSGGLDVFLAEDFQSTKASNFSSGNNASFLGGGTVAGTLADEEVNPIAGNRSIKFTLDAGSANDYIAAPAITLDDKQKGQDVGLTFYYTYDGADDDITVIVYDVTNASVISSSLDLIKNTSNPRRFSTSVFIPSTCNSIRYGFQVNSASGSEVFLFDDVELSTNPLVYKNLVEMTDWESYTPTYTGFGTVSQNVAYWRRVGKNIEILASVVTGTVDATIASISLPTGRSVDTASLTISSNTTASAGDKHGTWTGSGYSNHNGYLVTAPSTSASVIYFAASEQGTTALTPVAASSALTNSELISMRFTVPISGWSSSSEHVVTPAKSNMSEWTSYTPTFTGFGTVSNASGQWRRVGDNMELKISCTVGTTTAVPGTVTIPSGYYIDAAKLTINNTSLNDGTLVGTGDANQAVAGRRFNLVTAPQTSTSLLYFTVNDATTTSHLQPANASVVVANGSIMSMWASVPIAGWDANATFLAAVPLNRWQTKKLASNYTTISTTTLSDLTFNNLVLGKTYRVDLNVYSYKQAGAGGSCQIAIKHNGSTIGLSRNQVVETIDGAYSEQSNGISITFTASATTLTFDGTCTQSGDTIYGDGSTGRTHATLTELNYHGAATTAFT